MASWVKEEEKNEKAIRALLKNAPNRRCINCNSLVRMNSSFPSCFVSSKMNMYLKDWLLCHFLFHEYEHV